MTGANPLIGTVLHKCLQDLECAQTHLGDDVKSDYGAAGRLTDADAGIADAISAVKAELNRRFVELRNARMAKKPEPAKTANTVVRPPEAPATIELKMPGKNSAPVHFAKTKRGVLELLDWVANSLNDAGTGIVIINYEVFEKLAKAGFATEVAALRKAAEDLLAPAEAEGD